MERVRLVQSALKRGALTAHIRCPLRQRHPSLADSRSHFPPKGTATFPAAYLGTNFLFVRCEAGLPLPFSRGHYIDAKTNHRAQHHVARMQMFMPTANAPPKAPRPTAQSKSCGLPLQLAAQRSRDFPLPHAWLRASCACAAKLGFSCPSTWSSTLTLEQIIDHSISSFSCRCDITPSTMNNNYSFAPLPPQGS